MFTAAIKHWDSNDFSQYFKAAVKSLDLNELPLERCCNHSAVIDKDSLDVMILSYDADQDFIHLKIGVFFCEVLSGCACSDDPSQGIIHENSYCELLVSIDRVSAKAVFTNVSSAS